MQKKYFGYAVLPMLAAALLGANIVSAHGMGFNFGTDSAAPEKVATHQQTMFTKQAELLGISVDDVKNAWASGKSLSDLAKEKGIDETQLRQKMNDARQQQMKDRLQTLVSQRVITQAQADSRLKFMEDNAGKSAGHEMGGRRMMHAGGPEFPF